ncbi:hypothetical protein NMG60_11025778 [Bertholletia excelsa]
MEQMLFEAVVTGNANDLPKIISNDGLILDKAVAGRLGWSPLHTAASYGHTDFVKELLNRKPELARVLDSAEWTALHLASAKGHVEVVKALVKEAPDTCLACDQHGRNPVHVAAMYGKEEALEYMVKTRHHAARARLDHDQTILHLCVKHDQLKALKKLHEMIDDEDFINAKDGAGNTVLHLAVAGRQLEIVKFLLENKKIIVNAKNTSGLTARDILYSPNIKKDEITTEIKEELQKANGKRSKSLERGEWVKRNGDPLMVVASLIATIAFQVGVNPPGGFWQEDGNRDKGEIHNAGEAILAYKHPGAYLWLVRFSTVGFVASLTTIVLLHSGLHVRRKAFMWILVVVMWLATTSTAACFVVAIVYITPSYVPNYFHWSYFRWGSLSRTILVAVFVFCSVMAILLIIHTIRLIGVMIHWHLILYKAKHLGRHLINKWSQSSTDGQSSKHHTSDQANV